MQFNITIDSEEIEGPKRVALGILLGLLPVNDDGTTPEAKKRTTRKKAEPEPVKAEPEPVKAEPEPVKAEPEPVKPEPEPVKAETPDDDEPVDAELTKEVVDKASAVIRAGHAAEVRSALDSIGAAKVSTLANKGQVRQFLSLIESLVP